MKTILLIFALLFFQNNCEKIIKDIEDNSGDVSYTSDLDDSIILSGYESGDFYLMFSVEFSKKIPKQKTNLIVYFEDNFELKKDVEVNTDGTLDGKLNLSCLVKLTQKEFEIFAEKKVIKYKLINEITLKGKQANALRENAKCILQKLNKIK